MLLPAKFVGGFSGSIVDHFGYIHFFIYSSALGLPAILLALYLSSRKVNNNLKIKTPTME
jgi:PAT family beta-lactamase induction signal transducer AmpG